GRRGRERRRRPLRLAGQGRRVRRGRHAESRGAIEMTARRAFWALVLSSAAVLMVTMGARQSLGLFVSPLNTSTGLGIVTISFALAVAQLVWGAIQPVAGAVSDRYGPSNVLIAGLIVLAIGTAITPFMTTGLG